MNLLVPKVIIIDCNTNLYSTYENYFDSYLDYSLEGVYTTIKEGLSCIKDNKPHIVFIEVLMSDDCGIEGIRHIRKIDSQIKIIMLSKPTDFELVRIAFKNGANGFLTKPLSRRTVYNALYAIECQGAFISNDIAKKVISLFNRKSTELFSARENQVIDLLRQGATYKSIAETLFVTASAINYHIQNIYLKLNVNSKSQALLKLQEIEKSLDITY